MKRNYEAYIGTLGDSTARKTRKRVDWICGKAFGERVLDVGCGQGITGILLGRTGKNVIGLDTDRGALGYARARLAEEPEAVRQRVEFRQEAFEDNLPDCRFDTIILGQLLSELLHPELYIEKAWECLKDGGTLLITVPFGFDEQKQTVQVFYYAALREILGDQFTVAETAYLDQWICLALKKEKDPAYDGSISRTECMLLEQAFYQKEKILSEELKEEKDLRLQENRKYTGQLKQLEQGNQELTESVKSLQLKLAESDRKVRQTQNEKRTIEKKYKDLANSKLGKLALWYWGLRSRKKQTPKSAAVQKTTASVIPQAKAPTPIAKAVKRATLPSITVVIPTYRKNDTIEEAVDSVLQQDYPADKLEIILAVNGKDEAYAQWLKKRYEIEHRVLVVHTAVPGAGAGRNYAKKFIQTEFVTYLDDDDYFTRGYLREMAENITLNTSVVCGRLVDLLPDGTLDQDTYLVKALKNAGAGVHTTPWKVQSMFSSPCAKLYHVSQLLNVWGDFDESLAHTEDVVFWVENMDKPMGDTVVCDHDSQEAYVRRKLDDSRSRPTGEKAFAFYITDRIRLIERYARELLKEGRSLEYRCFVLNKIDAATQIMLRYFESCTEEEQELARDLIGRSDCLFLNKSLFAKKRAIAFCHNFAPAVDASAFVASKRLSQINAHLGEPMAWTVVCADMAKNRAKDVHWDMFFARYQYAEKLVVPGNVYFNEAAQVAWAEKAFEMVCDDEVPYIYSRSMWVGSHVAALKYKQAHPNTTWIAEFSDPIYMGTDDQPRKPSKTFEGDEEYLNTFWKDVETAVFRNADQIIFTNANQLTYMLQYNPVDVNVHDKALVWHHPRISSGYADIVPTNYALNDADINIGYFGTFYHNRSADAILMFLENPMVHLHIFTNVTPELEKQMKEVSERIHLHPLVSHLEVFGISKKMDYLFLNDIQFPGELTPYLPSKLADYLSVDTPVLGLVYPNTPMSAMEERNLIKFDPMDKNFVKKLRKKWDFPDTTKE